MKFIKFTSLENLYVHIAVYDIVRLFFVLSVCIHIKFALFTATVQYISKGVYITAGD